MSCTERFSGSAFGAGAGRISGWGRPVAWICLWGLAIGLMGCQPRVHQAPPPPPPPLATPAPLPRPVRPTLYVTVNQLSLRTCPGLDCPKTSTLELNAEVERLGEVEKWTQIKVKKDGTIGYVSSRYLAPQPVAAAKFAKKKPRKVKHRQAARPPDATAKEGEDGPKRQGPSPPIPRVM